MSARAARSTLARRSTGSSITRKYASTGGRGLGSRPRTPRSIEMFRTRAPSGKVHAEEEDVAPGAVRQVHAHGRRLAQDRVRRVGRRPVQQLAADAQRLIGRVADAEHPLVPAHRAHAAAHLVGQGLERQPVVGCRERARHGLVRALRDLLAQEHIDRLFKTPASAGSCSRRMAQTRAGQRPASVAGGSDGCRTGRTAREPARRGCSLVRRNGSRSAASASSCSALSRRAPRRRPTRCAPPDLPT